MNHNQYFGNYLKELLRKYKIKNSELANILDVSPQFISSIITNKKTPSREAFNAILTFLNDYLTPIEKQILINRLIYVKTGIKSSLHQLVKGEVTASNIGEQILLEDFRKLNTNIQMEVIRFIRQKEIEMTKNSKNTNHKSNN